MSDDKPSIAELRRVEREHPDHPLHAVLLEIAAAALALAPELVYLQGPLSERLREALGKVRQ